MWQLKLAGTALGVVGASVALTLLAPDLNQLTRNIGLAVIVALAVIGVRWSSKACQEPGKLAGALLAGALVGGILLFAIAQPDREQLTGTIEVGVLIAIGFRRAAFLLAATMGPMAVFEFLRWRLEKAMAKAEEPPVI